MVIKIIDTQNAPVQGAQVVVVLEPLALTGYHAAMTTDINGIVNPPDPGFIGIGGTFDVYVNYTDRSGVKWYALGTVTNSLGNFWHPDPLVLQLTPGTVIPPGANPWDFLKGWALPVVGIILVAGGVYVVATNRFGARTYVVSQSRRGLSAGYRETRKLATRGAAAAKKRLAPQEYRRPRRRYRPKRRLNVN